ncbi:MAG: DUF4962 domain-containing protein, partial [Planctomycetota bacterium]
MTSKIFAFEKVLRKLLLTAIVLLPLLVVPAPAAQQKLRLDERPAEPGEWGYRPAAGAVPRVNPPSFSWRPERNLTWEIQCSRDPKFKRIEYRAKNIEFNVHCPPRIFKPGTYTWRYRGKDRDGRYTNWSQPRMFTIAGDAVAMPLPDREELMSRIPKTHPRLFLRPENLKRLRGLAKGRMKPEYDKLVTECERL